MIVEKLSKIVEETCKRDTYLGYSVWWSHIQTVIQYSKKMANLVGAYEEIVEISALLHDYTTIIDHHEYENHRMHGSEEAQRILEKLVYPRGWIEQVKHCIMSHRGSKSIPRQALEAQCLADGDAIALLACPIIDLIGIGIRMT